MIIGYLHIVWIDKATFETGLDIYSYNITICKGIEMEMQNLKPTFQNGEKQCGHLGK